MPYNGAQFFADVRLLLPCNERQQHFFCSRKYCNKISRRVKKKEEDVASTAAGAIKRAVEEKNNVIAIFSSSFFVFKLRDDYGGRGK